MLKKTLSLLLLASLTGILSLNAEPTPSSKKQSSRKTKKKAVAIITPAKPLPLGWSLVDGVWTHSDGYQYVKGQLFRVGSQTHKRPPHPPTRAEMDAATKNNNRRRPLTAAEIAAEKAAERERNLRPRPAPQTGTNL